MLYRSSVSRGCQLCRTPHGKNVECWRVLHLNISIHILHTFLLAFLILLTRRICQTITASQVGDHFLYSRDLNVWFRDDTVRRN